jgi:hypothetical protein
LNNPPLNPTSVSDDKSSIAVGASRRRCMYYVLTHALGEKREQKIMSPFPKFLSIFSSRSLFEFFFLLASKKSEDAKKEAEVKRKPKN